MSRVAIHPVQPSERVYSVSEREAERQSIAAQTDEFLARGGVIQQDANDVRLDDKPSNNEFAHMASVFRANHMSDSWVIGKLMKYFCVSRKEVKARLSDIAQDKINRALARKKAGE